MYLGVQKLSCWTVTLVTVIILTQVIVAQPHSENYVLKKWMISSGAGIIHSGNHQLNVLIGQSSPAGISSGVNYTLYSGLLQPMFGLLGTAVVWIWIEGNDVYLDWDDIPNAAIYYIYRSQDPNFFPNPTNLLNSTITSEYTDEGAVGDAGVNFFYQVSCGN